MPCSPNFCLALHGSELITQARDSHLLPSLDLPAVLCSSPDSLCTHKSQNLAGMLAKGEEFKREKRNADGWEPPVRDSQGADRLVMLFVVAVDATVSSPQHLMGTSCCSRVSGEKGGFLFPPPAPWHIGETHLKPKWGNEAVHESQYFLHFTGTFSCNMLDVIFSFVLYCVLRAVLLWLVWQPYLSCL